jgi:hypothetical protein
VAVQMMIPKNPLDDFFFPDAYQLGQLWAVSVLIL